MSGSRVKAERREARDRLDRLYASLPSIDCKRQCAESCGPIALGIAEYDRIKQRLGTVPTADWQETLDCPLLADGLCSVYDIRPVLCRLWGVIEAMRCPWGCIPERYLTPEEAHAALIEAGLLIAPERTFHPGWMEIWRRSNFHEVLRLAQEMTSGRADG